MVDAALNLAEWVREQYPYASVEALTHLKLQKLCFYCFGTCLAFGRDSEIGTLTFEAWKHGPVCRAIWREFKNFGADPIPPPTAKTTKYDEQTEQVLHDVVAVYGLLDAWSLRQQSHLEAPWKAAVSRAVPILDDESIREHFDRKLRGPAVQAPEYLADAGSLRLDGIPVAEFRSLHDLAQAVRLAQ